MGVAKMVHHKCSTSVFASLAGMVCKSHSILSILQAVRVRYAHEQSKLSDLTLIVVHTHHNLAWRIMNDDRWIR